MPDFVTDQMVAPPGYLRGYESFEEKPLYPGYPMTSYG